MKTKLFLFLLPALIIGGCCRNPMGNVVQYTPTPQITSTPTPVPTADKMKDGPLEPGEGPAIGTIY
jgi:hypothetical protein